MSISKVVVVDGNNLSVRIDRGIAGAAGPTGPVGPTGPTGPAGTGVEMKGSVATVADLPTTGNQNGDGWTVLATGDVYVWSE